MTEVVPETVEERLERVIGHVENLPEAEKLSYGRTPEIRRAEVGFFMRTIEMRRELDQAKPLPEPEPSAEHAKYLRKLDDRDARDLARAKANPSKRATFAETGTAGSGQDYTHPMDYLGPNGLSPSLDELEDRVVERFDRPRRWGMAERDGTPDLWEIFGKPGSAWDRRR
jgi:hypothetical protein